MTRIILTSLMLFANLLCFSQNQALNVSLIEINFQESSNPKSLIKGDTKVYFTADNGVEHYALWAYDILSSDVYMVKNLCPTCNSSAESSDSSFFIDGDVLYFIADNKLWKSDGTESGTVILKQLGNLYLTYPTNFFKFNDLIIFHLNDGVNGYELWKTDGTSGGTSILKNINPSTTEFNSHLTKPIIFGNKFYFGANDGTNGVELWESDGTEPGTILLKDIYSGPGGSSPNNFFLFNNELYFTALSNPIVGNELWKTNGTSEGTIMVKDINPSNYMSGIPNQFRNVIVFEDFFYFFANNGTQGSELWRSDGTENGTQLFNELTTGASNSATNISGIVLNDYFLFVTNQNYFSYKLWKSNGTVEGTQLIKEFQNNDGFGNYLNFNPVIYNDLIYFVGTDNINGGELWRTDGTTEGTILVKDIFPGLTDSGIKNMITTGGLLYFRAVDTSINTSNSFKLWRSDGTTEGTFKVSNFITEPDSGTQFNLVDIGNDNVLFQATGNYNGNELLKSNGTVEGTNVVKDINVIQSSLPQYFINFNEKLVFIGHNKGYERQLFITDGTQEGTLPIKEVNNFYSVNNYPKFTKVGQNLFFRARKDSFGYELWKTDGTSENTIMVKDISAGSSNGVSEDMLFMENNGIFYFKAKTNTHGEELWRSDGTEIGTYMVKDILPGADSGLTYTNVYSEYSSNELVPNFKYYASVNNKLYFTATDSNGIGIFSSDGTEQGTIKVIPGLNSSSQNVIVNNNNQKVFYYTTSLVNTGNQYYSLWSYDATSDINLQLLDVPSASSAQFRKSDIYNNEMYFSAKVPSSNGEALFKTDGTISGTILLKQNFIDSGKYIRRFMPLDNYLYFIVSQDTGILDDELWRTDGTEEGTVMIEQSGTAGWYRGIKNINGTLFFVKYSSSQNKVWYINDSMTEPNFFDINIINSDILLNVGINDIGGVTEGKLVFSASSTMNGNELYTTDVQNYLNTNWDDINFSSNDKGFKIFPNPTTNDFKIASENNLMIDQVEVYDFLGKKVFNKVFSNFVAEINIESVPKGIYLVKINSGKISKTYKLIVK